MAAALRALYEPSGDHKQLSHLSDSSIPDPSSLGVSTPRHPTHSDLRQDRQEEELLRQEEELLRIPSAPHPQAEASFGL